MFKTETKVRDVQRTLTPYSRWPANDETHAVSPRTLYTRKRKCVQTSVRKPQVSTADGVTHAAVPSAPHHQPPKKREEWLHVFFIAVLGQGEGVGRIRVCLLRVWAVSEYVSCQSRAIYINLYQFDARRSDGTMTAFLRVCGIFHPNIPSPIFHNHKYTTALTTGIAQSV